MNEKEYETFANKARLGMFEELKTFYDYKRAQDEKNSSRIEGWGVTDTMFEVVFEILNAKIDGREVKMLPINDLHIAQQACSMLLNFSYACDLISRGFVTFGRCDNRERRWYEHPLEEMIELIEEEIHRFASLNREARQKLQQKEY